MTHSDHGSAADSTSIFTSGLVSADTPDTDTPDADAPTVEPAVPAADALSAGTALLVVKRGPNAGSRFQLDGDVVSAGRHPDSDIFLDDVSVSRRHAEFRRTDDGYEVVDVGSLNGTYVNRESVESSDLASGDEIQIGKFRLVYLVGGSAGTPAAS